MVEKMGVILEGFMKVTIVEDLHGFKNIALSTLSSDSPFTQMVASLHLDDISHQNLNSLQVEYNRYKNKILLFI